MTEETNEFTKGQELMIKDIAVKVAESFGKKFEETLENTFLPKLLAKQKEAAEAVVIHKLSNFKHQLGDNLGGLNLDDPKDRARLRDTMTHAYKSKEEWDLGKKSIKAQILKTLTNALVLGVVGYLGYLIKNGG